MIKINGVVPLHYINNTLTGLTEEDCKFMLSSPIPISTIVERKYGKGSKKIIKDIGKCRIAFKGSAIRVEGELEELPQDKPYIRLAYQVDESRKVILKSIKFIISEDPGSLKEPNWEVA